LVPIGCDINPFFNIYDRKMNQILANKIQDNGDANVDVGDNAQDQLKELIDNSEVSFLRLKKVSGGSSVKTVHVFLCPHGHEFEYTKSEALKHGLSCPYCANSYRSLHYSNPELEAIFDVERNHPVRLDMVYPDQTTKVWWKCSEGHSYQASPKKMLSRKGNIKICFDHELRANLKIALENNSYTLLGKNLDEVLHEFAGEYSTFKCKNGHIFSETLKKVAAGKATCPECPKEKKEAEGEIPGSSTVGYKRFIEKLELVGGKFIDSDFGGRSRSYRTECEKGHKVMTSMEQLTGSIKAGRNWCAYCRQEERKKTNKKPPAQSMESRAKAKHEGDQQ